ncbi:MAG: membrane protein insertase YidC [Acidobacteriota bacterium]
MSQPTQGGDSGLPMERRLLLAIVLAVGILVVWQMIFPPPSPPPAPPPGSTQGTSSAEAVQAQVESPAAAPSAAPETGEAAAEPAGESPAQPVGKSILDDTERTLTVETDQVLVMFTNRGGLVKSWKLTSYKDDHGRNLELVPEESRAAGLLPLSLGLEDASFQKAANSALYRMEKLANGGGVFLEWADGTGREVVKTVRIGPGFQASITVKVENEGLPVAAGVQWGAGFGEAIAVHRGRSFRFSGRALLDGKLLKPRRITAGSLENGETRASDGPRRWGGLEDTYFAALFLPENEGIFKIRSVELPSPGDEEPKPALMVALELPPDHPTAGLYVGPKDYKLLESMGRDLQEVVHFQSGIWVIGPVVTLLTRVLFYALVFLHSHVVANWGWAIVILTALIKLIFWPVTQKAMLTQKHMQEKTKRLKPKIDSIKDRYRRQGKKDIESRQKMNQEVMAVYQKEGVNPMGNLGGCLPMLIQLPILYGFYNLLQVAIELRQAPFMLWIHDLSSMDPLHVLPIIMGGSMVAQQMLMSSAIADPMQRRMMYLTPVLFTFMFLNLPSGLVLYWLVNNLLGIVQQYMINRRYELQKRVVPARRAVAGRKA